MSFPPPPDSPSPRSKGHFSRGMPPPQNFISELRESENLSAWKLELLRLFPFSLSLYCVLFLFFFFLFCTKLHLAARRKQKALQLRPVWLQSVTQQKVEAAPAAAAVAASSFFIFYFFKHSGSVQAEWVLEVAAYCVQVLKLVQPRHLNQKYSSFHSVILSFYHHHN